MRPASASGVRPRSVIRRAAASNAVDPESLQTRKREVVERFGEWTAHNIRLPDGSYTKSAAVSSRPAFAVWRAGAGCGREAESRR
jgi:hypothetical protein